MDNKHLEWINTAKDLDSDHTLLDDFARWIEQPNPRALAQLTVRQSWQSIAAKTVYH